MRYKVIYHVGTDLDLKTKADSGILTLHGESLTIQGGPPVEMSCASLLNVEQLRMAGLGRILKLVSVDQTVFVTVVRFSLFGYFALVNYFRTGELYSRLKAASIPTAG
jgi:hypothetical protein